MLGNPRLCQALVDRLSRPTRHRQALAFAHINFLGRYAFLSLPRVPSAHSATVISNRTFAHRCYGCPRLDEVRDARTR